MAKTDKTTKVQQKRGSSFDSTNPQILRTRASILASTRELLVSSGYRSISVDAVSAHSGASRSTIYRHWDTIEDLLFDAFSSIIGEPIEPPDTGDFRQDILLVHQEFARTVSVQWLELLPAFIEAAQHDEHCAALLRAQEEAARTPVKKILQRAKRQGDLPSKAKIEWILDVIGGPPMYRALLSDRPIGEKGFLRYVIDLATR